MLTRIEIDGFKTFEQFAIDLAPFVVILGTNASGKSNLFDAIELLANLATQDVNGAIKAMRGEPVELFRRTQKGYGTTIHLAVEVLLDSIIRDPWGSTVEPNHTRLRYEVTLERRETHSGIERILITHENAEPILRKDDRWLHSTPISDLFKTLFLKYNRRTALLTTEGEGKERAFRIHQDGKQGRTRPATAAEATVLYSITNAEFPHLFALREELRAWRLLQLDPALLRRPSPPTAPDLLDPNGANLAAVLTRLKVETATKERPNGVLTDIAAELNALIPGVTGLDAQLDPRTREYQLQLAMRDGLPFSSRVTSDGTLRVLALLTLLHDPRRRGLICFEEPENGIHPARLKQLINYLRQMVTRPTDDELTKDQLLSQLLLNSHSPVVLAALLSTDAYAQQDAVLFADIVSVTDPKTGEIRRKTRLRPVEKNDQGRLLTEVPTETQYVSTYEVKRILDTVEAER